MYHSNKSIVAIFQGLAHCKKKTTRMQEDDNPIVAPKLIQISQGETSPDIPLPVEPSSQNSAIADVPYSSSKPLAESALPIISFEQRAELERNHWETIKEHLLNNDIEFKTGPIQSHVQFSNYCNLSCIMCWNGKNPRTKRVPPDLLEKIETQIGPHLSVMVPFSGSEPLVLTWDETRAMAQKYGVLLRITSNLQFLDEAKFHELKDITETLCVSIDCHIPEVLEIIRQRAQTHTVLKNLATTARLAREHNIECIVNVVLLTYNAPFLAHTIRYLHSVGIENVDVIQMVDINHESHYFDPLIHFSDEYIDWVKSQAIEACRELKMRLIWNVGENGIFDHRENAIPANPQKVMNDHNDWLLKHYVPGFCKHAYNRLRLEIDGDVAPCFLATEGQLSLGNLNEQNFDEIWNGTNAKDLRRGMYTGDVPSLCQSCRIRNPLPAKPVVAFTDKVIEELAPKFFKNGVAEETSEVLGPAHTSRSQSAPFLELKVTIQKYKFLVAIALGGQNDEIEIFKATGKHLGDGRVRIKIPDEIWNRLRPNLGYWWAAWQNAGRHEPVVRNRLIHCFSKLQPLPRLEGSTLGYSDEGHNPITNLGVDKTVGFRKTD